MTATRENTVFLTVDTYSDPSITTAFYWTAQLHGIPITKCGNGYKWHGFDRHKLEEVGSLL
jgi:hypothetical protein